jgi:hypothetical protein
VFVQNGKTLKIGVKAAKMLNFGMKFRYFLNLGRWLIGLFSREEKKVVGSVL